MARKYRPYSRRKRTQSRILQNIALVLIVLITGVVILIQTNKTPTSEPTQAPDDPLRGISLQDVLPEGSPEATDPEETPGPAAITSSVPPEIEDPESMTTPPPLPPQQGLSVTADETSPQAAEMIREAVRLRDEEGKIIAARELLTQVLKMELSPSIRAEVKVQLSKLAEVWLFSPKVYAEDKLTSYYLVQPGDIFERISKQYKVPYESIMSINGILRDRDLTAGQKIKVIQGPFNVVIYKDSFTMDLYLQDKYIKTYRVGLGQVTYETPTGRWLVSSTGKKIRPSWTDPDTGRVYDGTDPDYPLGSRWIGLDGISGLAEGRTGFAIHGTKDESTIGTKASRGCIRLYNGDVVELYDLLYGGVSEVLVNN